MQWTNHVSSNGVAGIDAPGVGSAASTSDHPQTVLIFVLGLASLIFCGLLGPVAWIMGSNARNDTTGRYNTRAGLLTAGWILGIISTVFLVLIVLVLVLVAAAAGA